MQVFNYFKIKVKFIYFSYESVPSSENSYNEIFFTKKKRYADQISPTVRVLLLFKQAVFERCRHYRRKIAPLLWTTTFHIIYYWLFRLTCSCFQSLFWSRVTTFWYPLGETYVVSIFLASLPFYQYLQLMATWLAKEDDIVALFRFKNAFLFSCLF